MGCMAAYTLAKRGLSNILLLEGGRVGNAATGQSAAMIMYQTGDAFLSKLAKHSFETYRELSASANSDVGLYVTGSVLVSTSAEDVSKLEKMIAVQKDLGIDCSLVDGQKIAKL